MATIDDVYNLLTDVSIGLSAIKGQADAIKTETDGILTVLGNPSGGLDFAHVVDATASDASTAAGYGAPPDTSSIVSALLTYDLTSDGGLGTIKTLLCLLFGQMATRWDGEWIRYQCAPHFFIANLGQTTYMNVASREVPTQFVALDARLQGSTDDLTFLQAQIPSITWVQDLYTPGFVGAFVTGGVTTGYSIAVEYHPLIPSGGVGTFDMNTFQNDLLNAHSFNWGNKGTLSLAEVLRPAYNAAYNDLTFGFIRTLSAPHFLINKYQADYSADAESPDGYDGYDVALSINPDDQHAGESDVDFLNRSLPLYVWMDDVAGIEGLTGAYIDWGPHGQTMTAVYSPLTEFHRTAHILGYTPSSGPPKRSVLGDVAFIMSLIPTTWG